MIKKPITEDGGAINKLNESEHKELAFYRSVVSFEKNQKPPLICEAFGVKHPAKNCEERNKNGINKIVEIVDRMQCKAETAIEQMNDLCNYKEVKQRDKDNALLWILYHHQGANSPIGQPIRKLLGIGQFDRLTDEQIASAKSFAAIAAQEKAE